MYKCVYVYVYVYVFVCVCLRNYVFVCLCNYVLICVLCLFVFVRRGIQTSHEDRIDPGAQAPA